MAYIKSISTKRLTDGSMRLFVEVEAMEEHNNKSEVLTLEQEISLEDWEELNRGSEWKNDNPPY